MLCYAGGLVYVSDRVGEHDFALLRRLVLPDGGVLRCRLPGRPTTDCLFRDVSRDKQTVLKVCGGGLGARWGLVRRGPCTASHQLASPAPRPQVWNLNSVTGVLGLFNVQAGGC